MKKIILTRNQLKEAFDKMNYNTPELKKIQKRIYKTVSNFCGKMHSDDAWQNVSTLIQMIKSVDGVVDVAVGSGEYFNYLNPEKGAYRDYQTTVETEFGKLYGYIRCNAAGTMEDIFKYYDITISLYPDKTRDMNESKILKEDIPDSKKSIVNFDGTNANDMGVNAQEKYNDALKTGLKQNSILLQGKTINNNASDNNETIIGFDTNKGNIKDAVTNSILNAVNNGADINKLNIQGNAGDILNGTNESKIYTKKQVEEARLHEMKKNGKIMTKKQLSEEIANSLSLKEKLSTIKNPFKLLQAVKEAFGDAALQSLSTTDLIDGTVRIYENATISQQERFLQLINGGNRLTEDSNE